MEDKKSLVKIAHEARFENILSLVGLSTGLIGSIMSDDFQSIYFRLNGDYKTAENNVVTDMGTVDVLGVKDPYDYETCKLYRLERRELIEKRERFVSEPLNCSVNLDHKKSLYSGNQAVEVLKAYAKTLKGELEKD